MYLLQSFLDSAQSLPKEIAKKVWKALHHFSRDPYHPGLHFESLRGNAAGLRSLRVDDNYRIILKDGHPSTTLIYVASEDEAYRFAEKHGHPAAGVIAAPTDLQSVENLLTKTAKYVALARFFLSLPRLQDTIDISFPEIRRIIQGPLPPSAYRHRAWWGNSSKQHVQAAAWLAVGWRVHKLDFQQHVVTFSRMQ